MPRRNRGPHLRWIAKRGCWYITWTERGRSRERSTGTADQAAAHHALAEFLRRWNRPSVVQEPEQVEVIDVLERYADEAELTPTAAERVGYAVVPLSRFFNGKVSDVTREACRRYARERGVSAGTVRRELGVLRAAINHEVELGRLARAPTVFLPEAPEGRDRWLTRQEAARLLRAARAEPKVRLYLPLFILIGLYTGARKEAILSLRWPQVDQVNGRIDFNPPGRKRTSKGRAVIPVPRRLATFLRLARKRGAELGFVVHRDGERLGDIKKGFAAACETAGLDAVTPHTLRHTCGTWLAQQGVPLYEVAGYLGHSDARTTELYAHHHPDYLKRAREALG